MTIAEGNWTEAGVLDLDFGGWTFVLK